MGSSSSLAATGLEIRRRRPDDTDALSEMYGEVFGPEEAAANLKRWRWQYEENPFCPPEGPEIWVAREGDTLLGQYATMPVRLKVKDEILRASWGMDVMVRKNLQRRGVGTRLFLYWDQQVEASLGLGLSPGSYSLFKKLHWEDVGPIPCYTRLIDVRALLARRLGRAPAAVLAAPARWLLSLAFPARALTSGAEAVRVEPLEGPFGAAFDALWERASAGYDFVAERSAAYLEWKYRRVPFITYEIFHARRGDALAGYLVARVQERRGVRLGLLVDLFAHPDDEPTIDALIDRAVRWGRERGVGRLQTFTLDRRWGARLRRLGFFEIGSPMEFCLKINAGTLDSDFFKDTSRWHVTFGDSDQDRRP